MLNINFTPFPQLVTERLVLRSLVSGDVKDMSALRSKESMSKYINRPKTLSLEEAQLLIEKLNGLVRDNISIFWAVNCKPSDTLIGTVCLWNISEEDCRAELGYELHPDFQGKGIMHEAVAKVIDYGFSNMHLKIIEAVVNPENSASIRVLERFNFLRDTRAETRLGPEDLKDNIVYSLVRS